LTLAEICAIIIYVEREKGEELASSNINHYKERNLYYEVLQ